MHQSTTLYIGMDVHKASMAVAYIAPDHGAEVPYLGTLGTRQADIDHTRPPAPIQGQTPDLRLRSRAVWRLALPVSAPTRLRTAGSSPPPESLKRPGIGSKRTDAMPCHWPDCMRSGDLTPVYVPQVGR